jgi:hypothetical protein
MTGTVIIIILFAIVIYQIMRTSDIDMKGILSKLLKSFADQNGPQKIREGVPIC